jgi:hypothetical protein
MTELANAALKFPVAISSFGVQKLLGVLPLGDSDAGRKLRANLYKAGDTAKKEFSTNTTLFGAFQFADKAQTDLIDFAADTVTLKVLSPTYMWNAVTGLMHGGSGAIGSVATATSRRLLKEQFGNTFDVIGFVNHVDAPSSLSADGTYPIDECVERLYARGDYPALWLIEGLGERYAEAYMAEGRAVKGLLSEGKGATLPDKTQLMMHAGIGITFAKHALGNLTPMSTDEEVNDALKTFLDLVEDNSQERYKGAALESLGLVTRTWYIQMVNLIYDHLALIDGPASEFFWHGAGRAMYFSPMYMLPGFSPWHAASVEPPNETAKRNARAGVAWAFTIVNIRQPEITSNFLAQRAEEIEGNDAFTDGVYSTLIMAGEMVPGHRYVTGYSRYKPDAKNAAAVSAWNQWVGTDCEARINFYRQTLKSHGKLGEVFRYHALPDYVAELSGPIATTAV